MQLALRLADAGVALPDMFILMCNVMQMVLRKLLRLVMGPLS